uniref:Uncharacterized protein n=1 Tax=Setaria italica TaxID=4555 RepID=K3Y0U0_SETIT
MNKIKNNKHKRHKDLFTGVQLHTLKSTSPLRTHEGGLFTPKPLSSLQRPQRSS